MDRFTFYSSDKEDSCSLSRCMCTSVHAYSRPSLLDSVSCSPPVSSVHGIYWSGLPFPSPGYLPDLGIKPASLTSPALAGRFFTTSATSEAPTPWNCMDCVAHQAPLSMEFSRQEYWSGLPCPFSRGTSWPRDQTCISYISCIGRWVLYY